MHQLAIGVADCSASRTSFLHLAAVALGAWLAMPLAGQCTTQWITNQGTFGVNGSVVASTLWDPDGLGPLGARLVVAGSFSHAAYNPAVGWTVSTPGVASYDLTTRAWSGIGGLNGIVSIKASPTGGLFAASGTNVWS